MNSLNAYEHNKKLVNWYFSLIGLASMLLIVLLPSGCIPSEGEVTNTDLPSPPQIVTPSSGVKASNAWNDASAVVSGICFEAALYHIGQVFVIRDANQHIQFYDQIDALHLCRQPVTRYAFDFSNGRILAGLWSAGRGCIARHDIIDIVRDDRARQIVIRLRFISEGICNYELVRPFWIDLEGVSDYSANIVVNQ